MDSIQLLLVAILIITTILMIVVGMQLILTLGEIRKTFKKTYNSKPEKINKHQTNIKKAFNKKKYSGMHSIIDKIRILSPISRINRKKFFYKIWNYQMKDIKFARL